MKEINQNSFPEYIFFLNSELKLLFKPNKYFIWYLKKTHMLEICIFVLLSKQKIIVNFRTRYFCWIILTHQPFPLPQHASYKLNICSGNINNFSPKLTHTEFQVERDILHLHNPSFCQHNLSHKAVLWIDSLMNVFFFCLLRIRLYCVEKLDIKNKCELMLFLWAYYLFDNLPST